MLEVRISSYNQSKKSIVLFVEAINYGRPPVHSKPHEPVSGLIEDYAFHLSKDEHRKSKPASPSEAWKRVYKRYQERKH